MEVAAAVGATGATNKRQRSPCRRPDGSTSPLRQAAARNGRPRRQQQATACDSSRCRGIQNTMGAVRPRRASSSPAGTAAVLAAVGAHTQQAVAGAPQLAHLRNGHGVDWCRLGLAEVRPTPPLWTRAESA
eukprot:5348471-Pleurochrysis_carterae.AAC.1